MMIRHVHRFLTFAHGLFFEDDGLGRVSQSVIRHHTYHADTRGIDWSTWRTPKELAQMRRQERRAALRIVGKRA